MIPQTSNIISTSGLPCPKSGIWESMGNFKTRTPLARGEKIPHYCGAKIKWKLIQIC